MNWLGCLVDSGEFSANSARTNGGDLRRFKHVTVERYAAWLDKLWSSDWCPFFDGAITLDYIGHPSITMENFKELLALGAQVVPVFHADASEEYLEFYLEHRSFTANGPEIAYGLPKDENPEIIAVRLSCQA
jgi:hypothetical protein